MKALQWGTMDPRMMKLAQEQMARMSPEQLRAMQEQMRHLSPEQMAEAQRRVQVSPSRSRCVIFLIFNHMFSLRPPCAAVLPPRVHSVRARSQL